VGRAVGDIQGRLAELGFDPTGDPGSVYGPATRMAVEAFQHRRGLRVDGVCGPQTWDTLVEAGFALGDRLLYLRSSMLRGDDVAELQQRLGALGFDTGRVDGIFGPQTCSALIEFQRNAGQPADGIVGATTVRELRRVQTRQPQPELVSTVRDRERLRQGPHTLTGRHVAAGEVGGLATVVAALHRHLSAAGAQVTELHHPDGSRQARLANRAEVDAYVGLRLDPALAGCATAYYAGYRTESPGGRRLAEAALDRVLRRLDVSGGGVRGMSVPVLRETRMPAVIVELGPATLVVERGPELARALVEALGDWAAARWD
jgi:N-acetylmuramoyl-L-alanine amidase